jgi:hypothetical protein
MRGTLNRNFGVLPDAVPRYRVLLDQNFPKPPGFDIANIDNTVEVVHVFDFDPALAKALTPDWLIYLRAVEAGFDALVTRDVSQLNLLEELWVLSRVNLTLITFRKAIEDPIVEWGQLLAFLPLVRKRPLGQSSSVIHLPKPGLSEKNIARPRDLFGRMAGDTGTAVAELRRDAETSVFDYLVQREEHLRFGQLLGW